MSTRTEYHRAWSKRNKDKIQAYAVKYLGSHPSKRVYVATKCRAKRHGIPFDLSLDDITVPTHCPILGIELKQKSLGKSGPASNSPSIDRIDPTKGYTKGNIQVISFKANAMKQDANEDELRRFAEWVTRTYQH